MLAKGVLVRADAGVAEGGDVVLAVGAPVEELTSSRARA